MAPRHPPRMPDSIEGRVSGSPGAGGALDETHGGSEDSQMAPEARTRSRQRSSGASPPPPGLRLGRFRRARKERRRRLAEELLSLQGPIPAQGWEEPQQAQVGPHEAHLAVVAAEERVKVAERRLEERMRQSSAEREDLVRTEARVRARAEAAERELAAAQDRVRELTRKLSNRDYEHSCHDGTESAKKESKLIEGYERPLTEIENGAEPRTEESLGHLDNAQGRLEELTRKHEESLSRTDSANEQLGVERGHLEQERQAGTERERKLASLKAAFEDCLIEAGTHARSEVSLREQLKAALGREGSVPAPAPARAAETEEALETEPAFDKNHQRSGADTERRIAELTRAVDAKREELRREDQARSRLGRRAQDRLMEIEDRRRNAEERAECAEHIARLKGEEQAIFEGSMTPSSASASAKGRRTRYTRAPR